ncbi:MAG: ABC transporter ATP-binding protein [Kiritimatiellae bacterium]|nr:ABC transporter ATP-binding protein [Kiritimatiellia bacterium]
MSEVRLEAVSKVYSRGDRPAVDGFSLDVKDGEFVVLVGPSGCGKSTTLRMVAGLETPTSGKISIGETDVTNLPPKDRDIAMVFQNYALYPHMTVRENLSFALKLRHFHKDEIVRRVAEAARSLGLSEYLERLPKALSGGQRQRVALGRAIVREPAVFLFDEPLSNLDAKMRVEMRSEIIRLHNRLGATMLYVTHDQTEAMTMGERIVVMDKGRIQQVAGPLEIYERPANRFVAGFIGTPPMNLFPKGTLSDSATVGLRPENIALGRGTLRATVDFTESLGSETLVHVVAEGVPAIVRVGGFSSVRHGESVMLEPDMSKAVEFRD